MAIVVFQIKNQIVMKTLLGLIRKPADSGNFIQFLMSLAEDLELNVNLLYVENPTYYPLGTPDTSGAAMARLQENLKNNTREVQQQLTDLVIKLKTDHSINVGVEVSAEVRNETLIIKDMVDKGEAHMLAIGFKEMDGFLLKDSFVRDIVRQIQCPIWVIPESDGYHSLKNIIYATDYNEEDIPTLKNLIALTRSLAPQIIALHVTDSIDFDLKVKNAGFQQMLETETQYSNLSLKVLVEPGGDNIVKLINSYAAMNSADLIVVLKENKNFLERIFNPSSAESILQDSEKPVLVYHL